MTETLTEIRREGNLSQFTGKKYLGLETYRRNGQPVFTPVWFVTDNGLLYVLTHSDSGKARRIRKNPRVRVVAVTPRGRPDGAWVEGKASITGGSDLQRVKIMMDAKYGLTDKMIARLYRWVTRRQLANTVVSIRLQEVS